MRLGTMGCEERLPVVLEHETESLKASSDARSVLEARRTAKVGKVCAMNFRKKLTKTNSGRSSCFDA